MLTYANTGKRNFELDPNPRTHNAVRRVWEFFACMGGNIIPVLFDEQPARIERKPTLWAFPPNYHHDWNCKGSVERAVFHFRSAPFELTDHLPRRGYYRTPLTDTDCAKLRELAVEGGRIIGKYTVGATLSEQMILMQLTQMAMREAHDHPLSVNSLSRIRIERALAWFSAHMTEGANVSAASRFLNMTPTHLRRIFLKARGEAPKVAFNRIRMQRAEYLLQQTDRTIEAISEEVGLSSATALSRAAKAYFGCSPSQLRDR